MKSRPPEQALQIASRLRRGYDPSAAGALVDIAALGVRVAFNTRGFARTRGVKLHVVRPGAALHARCDPSAAEQMLTHLVFLALASAPVGDCVELTVESDGDRFSVRLTHTDADLGPRAYGDLSPDSSSSVATDEAVGLAVAMEVCRRCGWFLALEWRGGRELNVSVEGRVVGVDA